MSRNSPQQRTSKKPAKASLGPHVGPELNDEQLARKAHLLARFRHMARCIQGPLFYSPQPHDEMCDELELCVPEIGKGRTQKKRVYLAPRYTYKTSLLIAFMVYCILLFREQGIDISIDYVRSDAALAREVLYELKMVLQMNEEIVELWGDLSQIATIWKETQINLSPRRDHTVSTSGLNAGAAGKHPDIVIFDDIVNEKNYNSIRARRAGRNKVQAYFPVLPPWGSMIVSGTRFAHDDVYGWILEQNASDARKQRQLLDEEKWLDAAKFKPQWEEYIRSVRDAKGNLFFPTKLDDEFLAQQQRSIEAKFYSAWYLNRPDVEGMNRFRLEYLSYFSGHFSALPYPVLEIYGDAVAGQRVMLKEFPVRLTMTIDPTVTANSTSDWTGISLVATDAKDEWWVLLVRRYLQVPSEIGEIAVKIIREFRPAVCLIESANADVGMVSRIQAAITNERIPTVVKSYHPLRDETGGSRGTPSRRQKAARIEALEPGFRNGKIHLMRATCEALYDQYKHWPDLEHDDAFDALAMQYGLARKCEWKTMDDLEQAVLDEDDDEAPGKMVQAYLAKFGQSEDDSRKIAGRAGLGSQRLRRSA